LSAKPSVKKAAGFDFFAASSPERTILLRSTPDAPAARFGGTMSSRMHGSPAFAKCAAIREPMVPAPSTAAFSMRRFIVRPDLLCPRVDGRTGYKTGIPRSNGPPQACVALKWIWKLGNIVSNAIDWLRGAKDRLRDFAYGSHEPRQRRPRVGLALA